MAPQSYLLGGKIRAVDFNGFADDINEIVGIGAGDSGYGQNQLVIANVAPGTKINASHMQDLLTALKFAGRHQATTIQSPEDSNDPGFPSAGDLVELIPNLVTDIEDVRSNKLNFDLAYMTLESNKWSDGKQFGAPGNTSGLPLWQGNVYWEFSAAFGSEDARRHFFNTGGQIRIDTSLTSYDSSHNQSVQWNQLLSSIGAVKMSHNLTESPNSVGTPGQGFTSLTTTYSLLYTKGGTGYYSANKLNIYGRLNGTQSIDIKVEFDDGYPLMDPTDPYSQLYVQNYYVGQDYVDGNLQAQVDILRADDTDASGNGVVIISPSFSHIAQL